MCGVPKNALVPNRHNKAWAVVLAYTPWSCLGNGPGAGLSCLHTESGFSQNAVFVKLTGIFLISSYVWIWLYFQSKFFPEVWWGVHRCLQIQTSPHISQKLGWNLWWTGCRTQLIKGGGLGFCLRLSQWWCSFLSQGRLRSSLVRGLLGMFHLELSTSLISHIQSLINLVISTSKYTLIPTLLTNPPIPLVQAHPGK